MFRLCILEDTCCSICDSMSHQIARTIKKTRLNIFDEISIAGYKQILEKVSQDVHNFTQCHNYQHGSIDRVCLGDFGQLNFIQCHNYQHGSIDRVCLSDFGHLETIRGDSKKHWIFFNSITKFENKITPEQTSCVHKKFGLWDCPRLSNIHLLQCQGGVEQHIFLIPHNV